MKAISLILLISFCGILLYASLSLPGRGDPEAPIHRLTSPAGSPGAGAYYIQKAYDDAHTPNMVTVTLADYRGFDTLGETLVIFTAGIACFFILRERTS